MSELILGLSEKHHHKADGIRAELSKHLKVGRPNLLSHFSADPALPSFIQILGDAVAWLPLYAAATAYLAALAKRAGEATWDKLFNRKEAKPITDVATTLATVAADKDGKVRISFGLNIPDDYFGTSMFFESPDSEDVARALACFVVNVEQLSKAMQAEVAVGRVSAGPAIIELQDDESLLVRWRVLDKASGDSDDYELQISRTKP